MSGMAVSFQTLVSELGMGTQCSARFSLRTDPAEVIGQIFTGIGFGIDAWSARQAAEGEALERATWQDGALWNSVYFPDELGVLPEEARLMLKPGHLARLAAQPAASIPAAFGDGAKPVWIPAEAVFFQTGLAQDLKRKTVTTGWAYHTTQQAAAATAYREVIERDLQMLFWFGRLTPYLSSPQPQCLEAWLVRLGLLAEKRSLLRVLQVEVTLAERFGGAGWFTLVFQPSVEMPYLSLGSALKTDREHSFRAALGEYWMLRCFQKDQLLCGVNQAEPTTFTAHVIAASHDPTLRDRALTLTQDAINNETAKETVLNYQALEYWVAFFQPPPIFPHGVVAKAWVDGCQPMIPAGFPCGLTARWRDEWSISLPEWEAQRWHPYP